MKTIGIRMIRIQKDSVLEMLPQLTFFLLLLPLFGGVGSTGMLISSRYTAGAGNPPHDPARSQQGMLVEGQNRRICPVPATPKQCAYVARRIPQANWAADRAARPSAGSGL